VIGGGTEPADGLAGRGRAQGRIFRQRTPQGAPDSGGEGSRRRLPFEVPGQDLPRRSLERRPAGQQFVGDHGERVDVRGAAGPAAADELRRHVERRAEEIVRRGQAPVRGAWRFLRPAAGRGGGRGGGDLRQTEIEHLDLFVPSAQQDVSGLEVAMEDAPLVGGVDGGGDRGEDRQRPVEGQRAFAAELGEGRSLQQLHHEVGSPRPGIDPGIGDVDDVGVPEPSERLGLPLEAAHREGIESRSRLQQLEREDLLQPEMSGAVDDAGRPFAEAVVQAVLPVENAGDDRGARSHGFLNLFHPSLSVEKMQSISACRRQDRKPVAPSPL
jgi:hypothetical protein